MNGLVNIPALTPMPLRGCVLKSNLSASVPRSIAPSAMMVTFSDCTSTGFTVTCPLTMSTRATVQSTWVYGSCAEKGFSLLAS